MATQFELDCALMAGASYYDSRADINRFPIPDGWTKITDPDSHYSDTSSGFEALSFVNGNEIVISYAGTYDKDITGDIAADIGLATGFGSEQLLQAAEYYLQVKALNKEAHITLTGHSLGGGLAALVGVFFGARAVTFDQAPFANSAEENLLTPDVAANLKSDLLLAGYSEADLAGLTSFLQLRDANGGIPNSNIVSNIRVDGEFLSSAPLNLYDPIGTSETVLYHGPYSDPSLDMHSISLLTAFLQSEQVATNGQTLSEVTKKLTNLLGMFFDDQLFARDTDPNSTEVNLLERLVQHQAGMDPTTLGDDDNMVSRFTTDMWKIAQDGGLSLTNANISKMLTAFAMQKYYEEPASGDDHGQTLFNDVTGGIRFNRADVANTLDAAKGYKYFQEYLGSLAPSEATTALMGELPNLLDWYIQAGSQAMEATAGDQRAFMLGGSGDDTLTGGSQADVLVGNMGQDTLDGGAGNDVLITGWGSDGTSDNTGDTLDGGIGNDRLYGGFGADTLKGGADADLMVGGDGIDTYYIEGADTIVDSGRNFIVYDGQILAGGFVQVEGTTNVYRSISNDQFTLTFNSPGHLVLNGTDSITFENQSSAADFENGDFGITLYDPAAADRTLTGTSGDDTTGALAFQNEGRYYFSGTISGDQPSYDLYPDWGEFFLVGTIPPEIKIDGGDGNDQLVGLAGSDYIIGGSGNDQIFGEFEWTSNDPVQYALLNPWGMTGQADILLGEAGKDVIAAGYGDDAVSGGDDNDFLTGGDGNNPMIGSDTINWRMAA